MFDGLPGDFSDHIERQRGRRFVQAVRWLRLCLERRRQRDALARLDARLLTDIGVSRDQAVRECAKPCWR